MKKIFVKNLEYTNIFKSKVFFVQMLEEKPAIEGGNPVRENFLIFGQPYIGEDEINEVIDTLKSRWIGTGPKTAKFEEMLRNYLNVKNAVALNSCTAALHLSLLSLGIGKGDEVITSPLTFCATANVIFHVGAIPVFADIDRRTMNINPNKIEEKITEKTKAIIPVHIAGRPCNLNKILEIAKRHNLYVIEDAAHAIGAEYHGKKIGCGEFGDLTCFSFYPTKNMTTIEGGLVTTNNNLLASKIKILGLHGLSADAWKRFSDSGYKHYFVNYAGFKFNLPDVNSSIGIHQLKKLDGWHKKRIEIWDKYNEAFKDLPVEIPAPEELNTVHSRHLYTLIIKKEQLKVDRDFILNALTAEKIGTGVHYTALHLHPFYKDNFGYKEGDFPEAEYIGERTISLPLSPFLSDKDVQDVIKAVKKVLIFYKK